MTSQLSEHRESGEPRLCQNIVTSNIPAPPELHPGLSLLLKARMETCLLNQNRKILSPKFLGRNKGFVAPKAAYLVVLVGGDRNEGGLWEDVGAESRVLGAEGVVLVRLHYVQPGLVFVH